MHEFYLHRMDRLLSELGGNIGESGSALAKRFGADVHSIVMEARGVYGRLIGQLPYIGGDANPLTPALVHSAEVLALFYTLRTRGLNDREIGRIVREIWEEKVASDPMWGDASEDRFNRFCADRRRGAAMSQLRSFPDDWVYTTSDGDGQNYDFAIDYTECGIVKWLRAQGAETLIRYMCQIDYPVSRGMNSLLVRTMTLAEGDPICDFRFKRGCNVPPAEPRAPLWLLG